jgi:hypothetical protein
MSRASLAVIENGWYTYRYGRTPDGDSYGFVTERDAKAPGWVSLLWIPGLVGLVLAWLVFRPGGFRRSRPNDASYRDLPQIWAQDGHDDSGDPPGTA